MTKEEAQSLKPFDVLVYTDDRGKSEDCLVKSVGEFGVFVLFRIQSTAQLVQFKHLTKS